MKLKSLLFFPIIALTISCSSGVKKYSLANPLIMDYWDNYEMGNTARHLSKTEENYYPVPLHYELEEAKDAIRREVYVSNNKKMENALKINTTRSFVDIENLYANSTYYIRVDTVTIDGVTKGKVNKFHTLDYPRTLKIEGVSNTRDIGGLKTTDKRKVAQGKIYRGAHLDSVTIDGIGTMVDKLGIKTDLDLRAEGEGLAGVCSPIDELNYINISGCYYTFGEKGISSVLNAETIKAEVEVFANPDNYPIYFHCAVGRDRTGTLAMILLALLGVDMDTILKEYELTFFSTLGHPGTTTVLDFLAYAEQVLVYITAYGFRDEKDTLADCAKNWLMDDIGVSEKDIETIKEIMLV